ncbi:MAG: hypothetical protein FJ126_09950 [Deltaproteobacteria bacterium]|nr:hypothetical protein [Deltaproteobacteria bacterium]
MDAGRGRKSKKGWQMSLGVKDIIFAGLGVAGLMMISFALGALAGRGDIYRAAHSWGLLAPEPPKAQWASPNLGAQPAALPPPAPGSAVSPGTPPAAPSPSAPTAAPTAQAKASPEAPVIGAITPASPSAPAAKKAKGGLHQQKAKDEELRKLRQEVARKLKFQNSMDTVAKAAKTKEKATPKSTPIKVAQFRDGKAAKARLAEMQKKGEKVTLKQTKDDKGPLYTIYKQAPPKPGEEEKLAKKSTKSGEKKPKPQSQKN